MPHPEIKKEGPGTGLPLYSRFSGASASKAPSKALPSITVERGLRKTSAC